MGTKVWSVECRTLCGVWKVMWWGTEEGVLSYVQWKSVEGPVTAEGAREPPPPPLAAAGRLLLWQARESPPIHHGARPTPPGRWGD